MIDKIKRIIKPDLVDGSSLPGFVQNMITKINIVSVLILFVVLVSVIVTRSLPLLFFLAIVVISDCVIYATKIRPFYAGKVKTVTGVVVRDSMSDDGFVQSYIKKRSPISSFTRRIVTISVDKDYCEFDAPVSGQYPIGSVLCIYTLENYITKKSNNMYKVLNYICVELQNAVYQNKK